MNLKTESTIISSENYPPNNRIILAKAIPLKSPLIIQIFPVYGCNLKCQFCYYGLPNESRPRLSHNRKMELKLFKKGIDDILKFEKIKLLRFVGTGEPLLHPDIIEMISYASKKKVAENIELITNGIKLTHKISKGRIDNGLTKIRISIYGVDEQMYQEICLSSINYQELIENINFFYEYNKTHGHNVSVYVKILNINLRGDGEKDQFYRLFESVSDYCAVEHVAPCVDGIDYSTWIPDHVTNCWGMELGEVNVCPAPFHLLNINPDGKVIPCTVDWNLPVGDIHQESLFEIWNGQLLREFQKKMLSGYKNVGEICSTCNVPRCRPFPEDILDHDVDRIKELFEKP